MQRHEKNQRHHWKKQESNLELNRLELSIHLNPFKQLREILSHYSQQPILGDV